MITDQKWDIRVQWKSQWNDTMEENSSALQCCHPQETAWGTRLCS